MSSDRTHAEKLNAILESATESIADASDQDILEEMRFQGLDPKAESARVKSLMLNTVRAYQQRALRTARQAYELEAVRQTGRHSIPNTPAGRRELFSLIVARQPQYAELFTAQHREFSDLTDSDIASYLEDLAELGVLERLKPDEDDGEA